jgi:hypothetical protein
MSNAHKLIQDLIFFYVKENYQKYLDDNKLELIKDDKIPEVIDCIYSDKKKHIKQFLKDSLKEIMKQEYIGDLMIDNICFDIFEDDELCKNRLLIEIRMYQQKKTEGKVDYDTLL